VAVATLPNFLFPAQLIRTATQPDCGCDQSSMKVDDDGLALARPTLSATPNRDNHL